MNLTESELKKCLSVQLIKQLLDVDMHQLMKSVVTPHMPVIIKYDHTNNEVSTTLNYTPLVDIRGSHFLLVDVQRLATAVNDLFSGVLFVLREKRQMTWFFLELKVNTTSYPGKAFITMEFLSTSNSKLLYY